MTDDPLDAMWARWNHIQASLFPWLREEVEPMTEQLGRLITILDVIGLQAFVPEPPRGPGRPPEDRRALARCFVAKALLGIPTTSALIERLQADKSLRRICGWERRAQVPHESTFSRAFNEFAQGDLPGRMHAALVERTLEGRVVGVVARDATEIEAREKPVQMKANDGKDDPPASDNPPPPRKRGRPRKDEQRPKPEPTRLERQVTQNLGQMLADLPPATSASARVSYLYDLMDAAYDAAAIHAHSRALGHAPIVDRNFRADHQAKAECGREVERLKLIHMPDFDDLIYA